MSQNISAREKQPSALYLLFATEMWERFSYYSLRGLFVLYLTKALAFDVPRATGLYGTFTGLVYLSPLVGGYMADKFLGKRSCIIIGGVLMAAGQFVLGTGGLNAVYTAMGLIILGNGFFKPNISSILGEVYERNDVRRDGGFTIFYMGINLGSFFANLIAGTIGEKVGWMYGFWTAGFGMILGLIIFIWGKDRFLRGKGLRPLNIEKKDWVEAVIMSCVLGAFGVITYVFTFWTAACCLAAGGLIYYFISQNGGKPATLTKEEKQRIAVVFIMAFFSIFFFVLFEQKGAALNLLARDFVDRTITLFGRSFTVPTTWFQSVNPMFIVLFAPVFSKMWIELNKKGREPSTPGKFGIAFWLITVGYAVLLAAAMMLGPGVKMGMFWLIAAYFFFTMGELCLSPIGLSLVTKLSPPQFVSIMMGIWFVANAAANKLAGFYSGYIAKWPLEKFLLWPMVVPVAASIILMLCSKKIKRWMHGVK